MFELQLPEQFVSWQKKSQLFHRTPPLVASELISCQLVCFEESTFVYIPLNGICRSSNDIYLQYRLILEIIHRYLRRIGIISVVLILILALNQFIQDSRGQHFDERKSIFKFFVLESIY